VGEFLVLEGPEGDAVDGALSHVAGRLGVGIEGSVLWVEPVPNHGEFGVMAPCRFC